MSRWDLSLRGSRPDPDPLETDDVKIVLVGTALWSVALVVLLVLLVADVTEVRGWWLGMCGYGIALGLYGVRYCRKRQNRLARDKAAPGPNRANPLPPRHSG